MRDYSKKLTAEAIGTFGLVLLGAGAVIVESHTGMSHLGKPEGKVGLLGIALTHGFTLAGMLYALGSISGGHFNPAVSVAFWLRQKLSPSLLVGYVLAQVAGALVAAMCLAGIFPDEVTLAALGTPQLAPKISALKGVVIEGTITFVLVLTILLATREDNEDRRFAGLAIGGTLAALIVFAGPLTGAAANPARFLGPAAISGNLRETFVYLVGPIIGGGVAALLTTVFLDLSPDQDEEPSPSTPPLDEAPRPAVTERGKSVGTVQNALRRAHELFVAGNGEEAASVLLPYLPHAHEYGADVIDRIRSLIIVIEEEHGRIRRLDKYRETIYSPGPGRSAGLSSES
jgi:aquaporin Z